MLTNVNNSHMVPRGRRSIAATRGVPIKSIREELVSRMVPRGKNAALRDATCNYAKVEFVRDIA